MSSLIQVRVEDDLKKEATELFDEIGLDLSVAIRLFLRTCVKEGGIPFEMKAYREKVIEDGKRAIKNMRRISEENGNCNMTLDEINAIIAEVREEMRREKEENNKKWNTL